VSGEPVEAISISNEETFDVDVRDREELYGYLRRMSEGLAAVLARRGMSARTVMTKVRYPDFAIATRSQSLVVGIDDAVVIGDLACSLLDRALRSRPGPIRLVGVGVSGLDRHRQLALPVEEQP
jgi:DNA polymerase-4